MNFLKERVGEIFLGAGVVGAFVVACVLSPSQERPIDEQQVVIETAITANLKSDR